MEEPESIARRTSFNPFQTYTYGPYVATFMDAHFDPYAEGLIRPGRSESEMERIERVTVPLTPRR